MDISSWYIYLFSIQLSRKGSTLENIDMGSKTENYEPETI